MKKYLALTAAAVLSAASCMAQDTMSSGTAGSSTDTMTPASGAMSGQYTQVDATGVRSELDTLRGYLNRIVENDRLAAAAGDFIHVDSFRRMNDVLLDNSTSLAKTALMAMGPAANIPPGLGEARFHTVLVAAHLAHARLTGDYYTPINEAKKHLDMVYAAMDRGAGGMTNYMGSMNSGMAGGSSNGMSSGASTDTSGGMSNNSSTPGSTMPGMSGSNGSNGSTGSSDSSSATTPGTTPNTTEPSTNQSNPAMNNDSTLSPATPSITDTPNTSGTTTNPPASDAGTGTATTPPSQ